MPATAVLSEKSLQGVHLMGKDTINSIPSLKRLEGKVAIITGGARGIGEATVKLFVKHGARVVIADVEDTLGNALAESLSPLATFVHCDVSLEDDVIKVVDTAIALHGRLDILFNNAGVLGSQKKSNKSILNFDPNEFDHIMSVNVKGVALGIKHAARAMIARAGAGVGGSIISTSSVAGFMGGLGPHAYTASKHAIIGLTKNTACELGQFGIRVNCISPFGVATSMLINAWRNEEDVMDLGLPCEEEVEKMEEFVRGMATLRNATLKPKDIAEAALYLASEESRYISGHNLVVDGGFTTSKNCVGL
ncbi:unnamed protein product [Amaranthus hypochondriacus]